MSSGGFIEGRDWPFVEPGEYDVTYLRHETIEIFSAPKVVVHFRVVSPGTAFGKELFRAFRVRRLNSKPRKGGSYTIGLRSDLRYTLCRLFPDDPKPKNIKLKRLRGLILTAIVRTVVSDHRQRPLPRAMQYSVIDDLLNVAAGYNQGPTT